MTTDIRDTSTSITVDELRNIDKLIGTGSVTKVLDEAYNQGLDHAIGIIKRNIKPGEYHDEIDEYQVITEIESLKKSSNPTPQRVTEQP